MKREIDELMRSVRPAYPGSIHLDSAIRGLDCADASMEDLKGALAICSWIAKTEYPETPEGTFAAMKKRTEIEAEIEHRIRSIICD
jgi:hypothetical protein